MKIRAFLASCDRLQRSTKFKVVMSIIVVLATAASIGAYTVAVTSSERVAVELPTDVPRMITDAAGNEIANPAIGIAEQLNGVLAGSQSPADLAIVGAMSALVALVVIWMGLFLTYLALNLISSLVCLPLILFAPEPLDSIGLVMLFAVPLVMSFAALMQGLRILYSYSNPVLAIARNVLSEALRMKISLVFIILLILLMASMPLVLDPDQTLRYRVQSFLRYSTGISFWLIALLVVFFGAATVTFEQREKVIWQTMTKPVAAWQYVLGKWLGVVSLAAVLLGVSTTGAFVFTQYLRAQTAEGETAPYVTNDRLGISPDRLMLETQVLAARRSIYPIVPFAFDAPRFDEELAKEIESQRQLQGEDYNPPGWVRDGMRKKLFSDAVASYWSIDPATEGYEEFTFYGLSEAKRKGLPLTFRYKINAEGNPPDKFYALTFVMEDSSMIHSRKTGLGFSHTQSISPDFIDDQGRLRMQILNGDARVLQDGSIGVTPNAATASFPADGLEISFVVGDFRGNFIRVIGVLWVKLAFLAMLAVCASTFSSFPIACLVSVTIFFIGESSGFVQDALPGWGTTTVSGEHDSFRAVIYHAADWISSTFAIYNELSPTARIADGRVLSWGEVSQGVLVLGGACAMFYLLGVLIFRSRQLAIYSGN